MKKYELNDLVESLSILSDYPADIHIRLLVPTDKHYYKGMYGMFERGTNTLLRRHTDTGFLSLPGERRW